AHPRRKPTQRRRRGSVRKRGNASRGNQKKNISAKSKQRLTSKGNQKHSISAKRSKKQRPTRLYQHVQHLVQQQTKLTHTNHTPTNRKAMNIRTSSLDALTDSNSLVQ